MRINKNTNESRIDEISCFYCKESCENLARCLECDKTFCNNTSEGVSHIVFHLVKAFHRRIEIGSKEISCEICNEKNVFKLCQTQNSLYCLKCNSSPSPVIFEKCLTLLKSKNNQLPLKSLEEMEPEKFLKVGLRFTPKLYLDTFIPLIEAECGKEREIRSQMKQENITLTFTDKFCYFYLQKTGNNLRINIGDELKFTHKSGLSFKGYICDDQFSEELKVKIDKFLSTKVALDISSLPRVNYTVEFIWESVCYQRMIWALKTLYKNRKCNEVFKYIIKGKKESLRDIKVIQPKSMVILNESQNTAIKAALTRTLTLIQGPPGTGKTVVSSAIVYNLVKQFGKKVLVVAPSNTAVDQLALKMNAIDLKVLRILSKRREENTSVVDFLCLHTLLKEFEDKESAKNELIEQAEVVCCTCVTSGQKIFNKYNFPFVLIDEAVQCTEPLSLISCVYGANKLILVGDHKQLGPTILNKEVVKYGFQQSLFERLLRIGIIPYVLNIQYRMHPDLCAFPCEFFYGGLLKSATRPIKVLDFPNNFFYNCVGKEEISPSGASYVNKSEAVLVEDVVRFLFKNGVSEQQIGVITPYEGQRAHILSRIFGNQPGNLEINNVDGFQGREKDFIIVSLVRSNAHQGIGFVGDKRRMNVTLTRAKHGLIIIGNSSTLYKNSMWESLLNWYDSRGQIFEGPLVALRPYNLRSFDMKAVSNALEAENPS